MKCRREKCVVFAQIERAEFRSANIGRIRQYGLEDRLKLARRADDLENVGGRGLLFSEQISARSSLSSRAFSIAITAWSAKVLTNSICLSVNGSTVGRVSDEDADHDPIANSGTTNIASVAAEFLSFQDCVSGSAQNIWDVNDLALQCSASGNASTSGL